MTTATVYRSRPDNVIGEVRQCNNEDCNMWFSWYVNACPACGHNATVPKDIASRDDRLDALERDAKAILAASMEACRLAHELQQRVIKLERKQKEETIVSYMQSLPPVERDELMAYYADGGIDGEVDHDK